MIIYGSKAVLLKTVIVPNKKCSVCNASGTLSLSVYRRHAQVFWIPIFPLWKQGVAFCSNCETDFKLKELSESIRIEYDNLKTSVKGPLWQFSGLGIVLCVVSWAYYASGVDKAKELEYINAPLSGDVYGFSVNDEVYSTMKVDRVTMDSIYVFKNKFEIDRVTRIYKIDKSSNYYPVSEAVSRFKIEAMHNSGEIINVERD